jgi:hypothetical protein
VPATELGSTGGERLTIDDGLEITLADAAHAWRDALPRLLGADAPT